MAGGRVEVVNSKGCNKLIVELSSSLPFRSFKPFEIMSPSSSIASEPLIRASGPFADLVICVTGLSKEARKQVMGATERLGGQYSPNLHPQCTHLVVQSFGGCKFEHAMKHGLRNGLFIVTLGWFVDSVRKNIRLCESLYTVKPVGGNGVQLEFKRLVEFTSSEKSCLPIGVREVTKQCKTTQQSHLQLSGKESSRSRELVLAGHSIYVDSNLSAELKNKVVDAASREGAAFVDHWFVGCGATHIVCEGTSIQRYLGHTNTLVTPLWILKTVKEKLAQRLVQLSADLARQLAMMLENITNGVAGQVGNGVGGPQSALSSMQCPASRIIRESPEERQQIVDLAKIWVRNRRGRRMQTCQTPIRPITPNSLLDSICWTISEPSSTASIYTDSSGLEDNDQHTSLFFDARGEGRDSEASFENFSRPLRERPSSLMESLQMVPARLSPSIHEVYVEPGSKLRFEQSELIFKNHFLTILFPIDRFGEMGPSSKTFFRDKGFTCLEVLDLIYAFYQENMSADEVEAAIHTDSRHADRLRSIYASQVSLESGSVQFKRIDFLGSRRSFEMLKRVGGDNNSNVYELLIRA